MGSLYNPCYFRHPFKRPQVKLNDFVAILLLMAGLQCYAAQETTRVRLVNGATPNEGRVEIDNGDGRGWGTICDNGWDYHDAAVVCTQLGYPAATYSTAGARYGGNPALPVLLENVACSPSHASIDECPSAIPSASCDHTNDAGVKCMVPGYLGCFSLLTIGSRAWTILDNSNDACIAQCKDLDYRYAGMSGSSCRCGSNRRFYFYNQYLDFYCNTNCKGDATQLCGNAVTSYFSVFDTTLGVCEDPGIPQNGNRSGETFTFADTVSFSCNNDYVLSGGGPTLQCILGKSPQDVKWNRSIPECVRPASTPGTSDGVGTSTIGDVTMGFMTSSESLTSLQNNQSLSTGTVVGIVVVMLVIVIASIFLAALYFVKKKKKAKATASDFQPEMINKRSNSADNIYEIDETDVLENEIGLTPSPPNGHTVDARIHAGNMGNGHNPRTLPSIHLYADVAVPREDLISPTSDYGTVNHGYDDDNEDMAECIPGDSVGETLNQVHDNKFYFVLEDAVANDNSKKYGKGQRQKQKPQVKAAAPAGRFVKKKPPRTAPKNLKTIQNQGTNQPATNAPHWNPGFENNSAAVSLSERVNNFPREGAVSERTDTSFQNEPKSPKYGNSEFHEVPKHLIENELYKTSDLKSTEAVGAKEKLSVPNSKTRLRNNSESKATPKLPPYANFDPKRRRSTGESEGKAQTSDTDCDATESSSPDTSPCYTNTEFHAIPDNMVDNDLYKPCTPGHIDAEKNSKC